MRYDTPMSQPLPVQDPKVAAGAAKPTTTATATATATPSLSTVSSTTSQAAKSSIPKAAPTSFSPAGPTGPVTAALPSTLPQMGSVPLTDLPLRQQLKHGLRDMYQSSKASGRNFAVVGSVFSGTECAIEGLRAKNDLWNGVAGGCITGGVLARKGGPQAVAVGCAGFAAFSLAIDAYMRMPEDERSRPIA